MVNRLLVVFFMLMMFGQVSAQITDSLQTKKEEVEGLISLYRFMLNTIGSTSTPVSEKETIINDSYRKVFRDEEVQIEDDLVTGRDVLLNKSVKGYLRDVDFFFKKISFDFVDQELSVETNEVGDPYFKIKFVCNLNAIDLNDSLVNRTYDRFVEINDFGDQGLKIVSIYTVGSDPVQQMIDWWVSLDAGWQEIFLDKLEVDSISQESLRKLVTFDTLDLDGNEWIEDISPLIQLRQLKSLNLSGTQVRDVTPIRYASRLESLDLSGTLVDSIQVFGYLPKLQKLKLSGCRWLTSQFLVSLPQLTWLDLSETSLLDYSPIQQMPKLQYLDLSGSSFQHTSLLSSLKSLSVLDLSRTTIQQVDFGAEIPNLVELDLSNAYITEIGWIHQLPRLSILKIDYTQVSDLSPADKHPYLKKIYADFTQVKADQVRSLMRSNPSMLILTETDQLVSWWNDLSESWQAGLKQIAGWNKMPSIESLIIFLQRDSLNLTGLDIKDGTPLDRFRQLRWLDISKTQLADLHFARELTNLEYLNAASSKVQSLEGIQFLEKLKGLDLSGTPINTIGLIEQMQSLEWLNIDKSQVTNEQAVSYISRHPEQLVIYRSAELLSWWDNLPTGYKVPLKSLLGGYSIDNLHRLTTSKSLELSAIDISDFDQLSVFIFLESLQVSQVNESYLPDLSIFPKLKNLTWTRSPLDNLEPLRHILELQELNISNTAVNDLSPLESLSQLMVLDGSSTQIKSIRPLRESEKLKSLNISNTRVWQLNWLYDIRGIETLICFNSRVSDRQLEQFRQQFPDCEITNF